MYTVLHNNKQQSKIVSSLNTS